MTDRLSPQRTENSAPAKAAPSASAAAATPGAAAGPDRVALSRNLARIGEQTQRLLLDFLGRHAEDFRAAKPSVDPMVVARTFLETATRMASDPTKLAQANIDLWETYLTLWHQGALKLLGHDVEPAVTPAPGDRRFAHPDWEQNAVFDYIKQSYLLAANWLQSTVRSFDGVDDKTSRRIAFYTRQFVDAMSPTNFVLTNPEVLRATIASNGENLAKGLENLLADMDRGGGRLQIKMTDLDAFEVGRDLAITPGKVVYRNDLIELIQYSPTTEEVYRRPLLVIPPWINKYYILDLKPDNSFAKWAVDQGHTVFMISWVNPTSDLSSKSFASYMLEGPVAALDAIERATGESEVNVVGYCLGGTLLGGALAYLKSKGDRRIQSATFLTAFLDFSEPGDLGVFIDEEQLATLEAEMEQKGYLEGSSMANTFNMLRANDLIWSFVVNNYLLGKDPFPFDLLYWNSDSTRMPATMHSFYLRKMYQENALAKPGGVSLAGVPIDLRTIDVPAYFLSTREDHIVPWKTSYIGARLLSGPSQFTLASSGHIAGVVNPPARKKYAHWTNPELPEDPEDWFARAVQHEGSWWPHWDAWLGAYKGEKVKARRPGEGKLKALADAPGTYVLVKS